MAALTLTRQELYEQVWSTPMRKLAAAFGLSDVGLAKICKRHKIPRPPRGYWAKLAVGRRPQQSPLPKCTVPELETIHISPVEPRHVASEPVTSVPKYDPDVIETLDRAKGLPQVALAATLRNLHPLVEATKKALEGATPDRHNLVNPQWGEDLKAISLSVSQGSVHRGLAFLDALAKSVEQVGGKIDVTVARWTRETTVSFCGERITTIRLRERCKQEKRTPPPKHIWEQRSDFIPTGRLVLDTGEGENVLCQDTEKNRRIEDGINSLIIRWVSEAGQKRIDRREAEERMRRCEEEERQRRDREAEMHRRRDELHQKQKAETDRFKRLVQDAEDWQLSQKLREFINRSEQYYLDRDGDIEKGSEVAAWLEWARRQADRMDPFLPDPPSVLDEVI